MKGHSATQSAVRAALSISLVAVFFSFSGILCQEQDSRVKEILNELTRIDKAALKLLMKEMEESRRYEDMILDVVDRIRSKQKEDQKILSAIVDYCNLTLNGEYGGNEGELTVNNSTRFLPALRIFSENETNVKPPERILLAYDLNKKSVLKLDSIDDAKPFLKPAIGERQMKRMAALVCSLFGSCRKCLFHNVSADNFAVNGTVVSGRYDSDPEQPESSKSYKWEVTFDKVGKVVELKNVEVLGRCTHR